MRSYWWIGVGWLVLLISMLVPDTAPRLVLTICSCGWLVCVVWQIGYERYSQEKSTSQSWSRQYQQIQDQLALIKDLMAVRTTYAQQFQTFMPCVNTLLRNHQSRLSSDDVTDYCDRASTINQAMREKNDLLGQFFDDDALYRPMSADQLQTGRQLVDELGDWLCQARELSQDICTTVTELVRAESASRVAALAAKLEQLERWSVENDADMSSQIGSLRQKLRSLEEKINATPAAQKGQFLLFNTIHRLMGWERRTQELERRVINYICRRIWPL